MAFIRAVFGFFLMLVGVVGLGGGILGGGWWWIIPGVILLVVGWLVFSPGARQFAYNAEKRRARQQIERGIWRTKLNNEAAQEAVERELKRRQRYGE